METYCGLLRLAGSVQGGVVVLMVAGAVFAGLAWWGTDSPQVAGGVAFLFLLLIVIARLGC